MILFDWEQSVLEVTKSSLLQDMSSYTDVRIGGALDLKPGDPLELRILLDNSCLEIFTGTGEVLTTRVYRGQPPAGADAGSLLSCAKLLAFAMCNQQGPNYCALYLVLNLYQLERAGFLLQYFLTMLSMQELILLHKGEWHALQELKLMK